MQQCIFHVLGMQQKVSTGMVPSGSSENIWRHGVSPLLYTTSLGIKALPLLHNHIHLQWQIQNHEDAVISLKNTRIFNITQTVCMHPLLYLSAFFGQNVYMLSVALERNKTASEFKESLDKDVGSIPDLFERWKIKLSLVVSNTLSYC